MKKLLLTSILILTLTISSLADAPDLMSYQGRVTDSEGQPVSGTISMTFRIYNAAVDGAILWEETIPDVNLTSDGLFGVVLGQTNAITEDDLVENCYIGITIDGSTEISPRSQLVSSAFAHRVSTIDQSIAGEISGQLTVVPISGTGTQTIINSTTVQTGQLNVISETDVSKNGVKDCAGGPNNLGDPSQGNSAVGEGNDLSSPSNSFSVGLCNTISSNRSVAIGLENTMSGEDNVIMGEYNYINGQNSAILGGASDTISGGGNHIIAGGQNNKIENNSGNSVWNTILGGQYNIIAEPDTGAQVTTQFTIISGGAENEAYGLYSTIGGGQGNKVQNSHATVAGGNFNIASGQMSFIGGGDQNRATGRLSVVGGGGGGGFALRNQATGDFSTVPGGAANIASGDYSFAAGRKAQANHDGSFVWADHTDADFATTAADQFLIRASGNVGINTTSPGEPLTVNGRIHSLSGGFRFPDGSVQSSAAASITDGWTDLGDHLELISWNDNVRIGALVSRAKVDIQGQSGTEADTIGLYSELGNWGDPENGPMGVGVYGVANSVERFGTGGHFEGTKIGVQAEAISEYPLTMYDTVIGVKGTAHKSDENSSGSLFGGFFTSSAFGSNTHRNYGIYCSAYDAVKNTALEARAEDYTAENNFGIKTYAFGGTFFNNAVSAMAVGSGAADNIGIYAIAGAGESNIALYGEAVGSATEEYIGIYAIASGDATTEDWAGFFEGDVRVVGTIDNSKSQIIMDHPLEPENKYLRHSSVNSSEIMNIYSGNTILDARGEATVKLPDYFEALNTDFRYQLTCIGGYSTVYISEEINDNQFKIAGGQQDMKISWQITAVRNDAFAKANPILVESDKSDKDKGKYLSPEVFGLDREEYIHYNLEKKSRATDQDKVGAE